MRLIPAALALAAVLTSASAQALADQGRQLAELVGFFKL